MKKELFISFGAAAVLPLAAQQRPNILWVMTDQHSYDALSCAGNRNLHTPNIDRIAAHGVMFTNTYCAFPLSGPSRAAMFTGLMPFQSGIIENEMPIWEELRDDTLGEVVRRSGYECAYAGKWHVNTVSLPSDYAFGFRNLKGIGDKGLAEVCVSYLESADTLGRPFFLVASFVNPHNICEAARNQNMPDADIVESKASRRPGLPKNFRINKDDATVLQFEKRQDYALYPSQDFGNDEWRTYRDRYYRLVEAVDAEIGKIVDVLDSRKLWDNTVVIFTADHGDGEGAHHWNQKTALYEEVVSVPLIVCLPGGINAGKSSSILVNNGIDMMPSVCELAGAVMPAGRFGESFVSAAEHPDDVKGRAYIVTETNFNQTSGTKGWMVRSARYKYVLYDKGLHREQLFDMAKDRRERHNLAENPKYSVILNEHRKELRQAVAPQLGKRAGKILR